MSYERVSFDQFALDPKLDLPYSNRGLINSDMGDYQRAIDDFNQAIMLNPNLDLAYYGRGMTYATMAEIDKSIIDLKKALQLTSDPEIRRLAEQELEKLKIRAIEDIGKIRVSAIS